MRVKERGVGGEREEQRQVHALGKFSGGCAMQEPESGHPSSAEMQTVPAASGGSPEGAAPGRQRAGQIKGRQVGQEARSEATRQGRCPAAQP